MSHSGADQFLARRAVLHAAAWSVPVVTLAVAAPAAAASGGGTPTNLQADWLSGPVTLLQTGDSATMVIRITNTGTVPTDIVMTDLEIDAPLATLSYDAGATSATAGGSTYAVMNSTSTLSHKSGGFGYTLLTASPVAPGASLTLALTITSVWTNQPGTFLFDAASTDSAVNVASNTAEVQITFGDLSTVPSNEG